MRPSCVKTSVKTAQARLKPRHDRPYCVILLDDNDHSFEYVIEMLAAVFEYPAAKGLRMAFEVHMTGRVVVATCHRELAALRQEQIHNFGPDPRIERCSGSMTAVIEPLEG